MSLTLLAYVAMAGLVVALLLMIAGVFLWIKHMSDKRECLDRETTRAGHLFLAHSSWEEDVSCTFCGVYFDYGKGALLPCKPTEK